MIRADAVFWNPGAGAGRGRERWARVLAGPDGARLVGVPAMEDPGDPDRDRTRARLVTWWAERLRAGARNLVVGGGDGTVQLGVDALAEASVVAGVPLSALRLGAVGLGTSNDFHKGAGAPPVGIPARLAFEAAAPRDFGELRTEVGRRWFAIGVSVGASAAANDAVHARDGLLWRVRRRSVDLAFTLAGFGAIASVRPFRAELVVDGEAWPARTLANLSVVKSPWLAGDFRFDRETLPADGTFGLHLVAGGSRADLVRALIALRRGGFSGCPGASSLAVRSVRARLDAPLPIEVDGESLRARDLELVLHPAALLVCP